MNALCPLEDVWQKAATSEGFDTPEALERVGQHMARITAATARMRVIMNTSRRNITVQPYSNTTQGQSKSKQATKIGH